MTMNPQVAALDYQIDDLKRCVKTQTLIVTDLIKSGGDTKDAEHVLSGLMDLPSGLRSQRFALVHTRMQRRSKVNVSLQAQA